MFSPNKQHSFEPFMRLDLNGLIQVQCQVALRPQRPEGLTVLGFGSPGRPPRLPLTQRLRSED